MGMSWYSSSVYPFELSTVRNLELEAKRTQVSRKF